MLTEEDIEDLLEFDELDERAAAVLRFRLHMKQFAAKLGTLLPRVDASAGEEANAST